MTSEQYKVMTRLKENKNIVIKKADKGSNVVIQNKSDYTDEGLRQWSERKFYKQINKDLTSAHRKQVQELIGELYLKKEISEQTFKFLSRGGNRTSVFYMLPKIHKNKFPVPGRPIVSSCDSPTEKISMLLHFILQPYVLRTKLYIQDTSDFLQKIADMELNDNNWIFTMDVMSLYTNIPHDKGIKCIHDLLNSNRQNQLLSNENLIHLLDMVLKLNNYI